MIKNNSGKVHYSILLLIFSLVILLTFVNLENRMVLVTKNKIENAIVLAAFSAARVDCPKVCNTISVVKNVVDKEVTYDFEKMYKNARIVVSLENAEAVAESIFKENVSSNNNKSADYAYELSDLIVYNVADNLEITSFYGDKEDNSLIKNYSDTQYIYSPNNVCIDETSIYLKVKFIFKDIFGKSRKLYLEKCIQVKIK